MFQTFILSIVQSIAEFLPISSSAHLVLVPRLLGWPDQGIGIDIGLHVGTLIAVVIYFWHDFYVLLTGFYKKPQRRLIFYLCAATCPALIAGFFGESIIETTFRNPFLIAGTMIFFGVVLYLSDKKGKNKKTIASMNMKDALIIGLAQCLALFPGVSRSGITMTAGRFCGIKRKEATKFSMILSVPVIAAAAIWHFRNLYLEKGLDELVSAFGFGILFSFIGGLLAVSFLMKWVKTQSFLIFAIYRVLLGVYVLYVFL